MSKVPALLRRAAALALGVAVVLPLAAQAQTPPAKGEMPAMHDMPMHGMAGMQGMHEMTGTVTRVDHKTGMIDVNAGGMSLRLHFPPPALAKVKVGEHITVHLAFSVAQ